LLNFLRNNGLSKGSIIYTQLPLVPANWFCYLAAIKGGYIVIPAATSLTTGDISYRFNETQPDAVITDYESAQKIDEAVEKGEFDIPVRVITDEHREAWTVFEAAVDRRDTVGEGPAMRPAGTVACLQTTLLP